MEIPPNARAKLVDDDLTQQHFLVYLPKPAPDGKPMGLIVPAPYKKAKVPPADIFPELDAGNVALIVSRN